MDNTYWPEHEKPHCRAPVAPPGGPIRRPGTPWNPPPPSSSSSSTSSSSSSSSSSSTNSYHTAREYAQPPPPATVAFPGWEAWVTPEHEQTPAPTTTTFPAREARDTPEQQQPPRPTTDFPAREAWDTPEHRDRELAHRAAMAAARERFGIYSAPAPAWPRGTFNPPRWPWETTVPHAQRPTWENTATPAQRPAWQTPYATARPLPPLPPLGIDPLSMESRRRLWARGDEPFHRPLRMSQLRNEEYSGWISESMERCGWLWMAEVQAQADADEAEAQAQADADEAAERFEEYLRNGLGEERLRAVEAAMAREQQVGRLMVDDPGEDAFEPEVYDEDSDEEER